MQRTWDRLLKSLLLVRLGQELGTDSRLARMLHDAIELVAAVVR